MASGTWGAAGALGLFFDGPALTAALLTALAADLVVVGASRARGSRGHCDEREEQVPR